MLVLLLGARVVGRPLSHNDARLSQPETRPSDKPDAQDVGSGSTRSGAATYDALTARNVPSPAAKVVSIADRAASADTPERRPAGPWLLSGARADPGRKGR
jgi:hypothetical protein